jgi:hypothetical protein
MVFLVLTMKQLTHDNDDEPFSAIGLQAALVVLRLQAQLADETKNDTPGKQRESADAAKDTKEERHRNAVASGVRHIARFERTASGIGDRPARKRRE